MKKNLHEQLASLYEPTPEFFHQRVQKTLQSLSSSQAAHSSGNKLRRGAALLAALLLIAAVGAAAKLSGLPDWITHTAARSFVLDEAWNMLHTDTVQTQINDYTIRLREWLCDGERLYLCVSVVDPELQACEEEDVDALRRCATRFSLGALELSQGEACTGVTWDYAAGEEKGEILYVVEQSLESVPDAFDVSVPVYFPEGEYSVSFHVTRSDYGHVRSFAPSPIIQARGYTAQITRLRATALRTYGELTLTFEKTTPVAQRRSIVMAYMEGLGVDANHPDAVAGEGNELLLAHTARWSADDLTCIIDMDGNPRETYPDTLIYYPRPDAETRQNAPLSSEGAVTMPIIERSEES